MKKNVIAIAGAVALSAMSMNSLANDAPAGSGPNPFSDCGIGAALFPTIGPLAVISNVIWDLGTTAVTSATASPETCSGKSMKTAQFIIDSYDRLAEDTARGQGEYLDTLMSVAEVAPAEQSAVVAALRAHMAEVTGDAAHADASLVDKSSAFYQALTAATPTA